MLIGMRIVADDQLLLFSDRQLGRFVRDACRAAKDRRLAVRLLALDVLRMLGKRLTRAEKAQYKVRALEIRYFAGENLVVSMGPISQ